MPKKMRRLALKCALSDKVTNTQMIALDELVMEMPKTKNFIGMMKNLSLETPTLFVIKEKDFPVQKSAANLPTVKVITTNFLNLHDLLKYEKVVMTTDAIKKVEEVLG